MLSAADRFFGTNVIQDSYAGRIWHGVSLGQIAQGRAKFTIRTTVLQQGMKVLKTA